MRGTSTPGIGGMDATDKPTRTYLRRPGAGVPRSRPHATHPRPRKKKRRLAAAFFVALVQETADQNFISKPTLNELRSCVSSLKRPR
jgi:hypothetical protein